MRHKNPWLASFLLRHIRRIHQTQKRFRAGAYALQCAAQARARQARQGMRLSRRPKQLLVSTITGTTLMLSAVAPALAGTITVTTTGDAINGGDGCSLREAIYAANNNSAYSDCVISGTPGDDTVDLTSISGSIVLGSDLPDITESLQINGPGAAALTLDGNGHYGLYGSPDADTVGVDSLTISNVSGNGIYTYNDVIVSNSVITGTYSAVDADNAIVSNSKLSGDIYSGIYGYTQAEVTNSVVTGGNFGIFTNGYYYGPETDTAAVSDSTVTSSDERTKANNLVITKSVVSGVSLDTYAYGQTTVISSTVTGTVYDGIHSYSNIRISDSTVSGEEYGVFGYTAVVSGSTVTGNNDDGISVYTYTSVTDSTISGGDDGVDANAGDIMVSNSVVSGLDDGLDARYSITATNTSVITGVEYGIYAHHGHATVISSTVTGNTTYAGVYAGTDAQAAYSTITGGYSGVVAYNTVALTNSTISGSGLHGIESLSGDAITINHATIANNMGYGIVNNGGPTEVNNSIMANNGGLGTTRDISGTISIGTYNLIGNGDGSGLTNGVNGNLLGSTGALLDAQLGSLQNNGGPTPTHLPALTSPVIDAGDPTFSGPPTFDQRGTGFARVFGNLDIGSVEQEILKFYFPVLFKDAAFLPDLIITNITATGSEVLVTIQNIGNAPVTGPFWVDVYYNLTSPPVLNQQSSLNWNLTVLNGGVPLAVGQSVTLSLASPSYVEGDPPSSGTTVYGQVDSVGRSEFGAVIESNEGNNIFGPVTATGGSGVLSPDSNPAVDHSGLPVQIVTAVSPTASPAKQNSDPAHRQARIQEQADDRGSQGWLPLSQSRSFDHNLSHPDQRRAHGKGRGDRKAKN
ncbi:MAG: CSLREA domain-containing protein [Anaerolineae bacterium]|nr:CSLREA domain-containing protein [Anaerolineae bacterium]